MAVLIEAISVLVKAKAIIVRYPGGWEQFRADVPNQTLCADGELTRVGFMAPADVQNYISFLESRGLVFQADGKCMDIAVADQQRGFTVPCEWADFGWIFIDPAQTQRVSACRLKGSTQRIVSYPDGWEYENSLSKDYHFVQNEKVGQELEFIRKEGVISVYRHLPTGSTVYSGSPTNDAVAGDMSSASLDEMIACNLLAHAYNTLNASFIDNILANDLLYTSQWVLDEMHGKQAFLDYLTAKFHSIEKAESSIYAELATYRGQHCLVIAQGSKDNPVATMLVKTKQGKISEICLCEVPHFSECDRFLIYP